MNARFPSSRLQRGGRDVTLFDSTGTPPEIAAFLRPLIVNVYNQMPDLPIDAITAAELPRITALLASHMPRDPRLMKSEFGEVLTTLLVEQIKGLRVPVYKHTHKTAPNMPVFGVDVIAVALDRSDAKVRVVFFFHQVKTSDSGERPPSVSYQLRTEFQAITPIIFDLEIAFIRRDLKRRRALSADDSSLLDTLDVVTYDAAEVVFCPFLVIDASRYYDGCLDPVLSDAYPRPVDASIARVADLELVYTTAMEIPHA